MRAIIIDDKDAKALINQLKLTELTLAYHATMERYKHLLPENIDLFVKSVISEVHSQFHYDITRWLQNQGANVL